VVLDNAGLELYTDLLLADCLIQSGLADTVVLHGKLLPWFVSDTAERDLEAVISALEAAAPPAGMAVPAGQWGSARRLAARWRAHLAAGRWQYRDHVFWTTPFPFWWMEQVGAGWVAARLQRPSAAAPVGCSAHRLQRPSAGRACGGRTTADAPKCAGACGRRVVAALVFEPNANPARCQLFTKLHFAVPSTCLVSLRLPPTSIRTWPPPNSSFSRGT
jgi:hypothetical protein